MFKLNQRINNNHNHNNKVFHSAHTVLCTLYKQLKIGVAEKMHLQGAFENIRTSALKVLELCRQLLISE